MYSNKASWRSLRHDSPPPFDGIGNVMPDRMCKTTRQKTDAKYNRNKKCRYDGVRPYCRISYEYDLEKTLICLEPLISWDFCMLDLVWLEKSAFHRISKIWWWLYKSVWKKGFWALVWTWRNKALWLSTNDCMMDLVNGATSFLPNDCKANASHYQNKSKPLSDERRRGQRILLSCKWQIILVLSLEHQDKSFPTFFNTRKNYFDMIIFA